MSVIEIKNPFVSSGNKIPEFWRPRENSGKIFDVSMTTSEAIRKFSQYGKVSAMNFASASNPGGGKHNGMGAIRTQEEHLLACTSDAYHRLQASTSMYPLYIGNRSLYLPNVHLERNDDLTSSIKTFEYDMMVAPAPNMNNGKMQSELDRYSYQEMIDYYMRPMLHNLFVKSINEGCLVIILGDWGCGVFAPKDPNEKQKYIILVRKMTKETSEQFLPYLKSIVFAVPKFA